MIAESTIEQLKTAGLKLRQLAGIAPSQRQLVKMIHDEFDTAPERLLRDVPSKLEGLESQIIGFENRKSAVDPALKAKVERLRKLGFTNTEDSELLGEQMEMDKLIDIEISLLKSEKKDLESFSAQVTYYRACYPFATFLTVDELDRICHKYGLVHAPASTYIGDVPEKNLREIENAQPLKVMDLPAKPIQIYNNAVVLSVSDALTHYGNKRAKFHGETIEELLTYLNAMWAHVSTAGVTTHFIPNEWISPPDVAWPNLWEGISESQFRHFNSVDTSREENMLRRAAQDNWSWMRQRQPNEGITVQNTKQDMFSLAPIAGFHIAAPPLMFRLDEAMVVKTGKYGYVVKEDPIVFKYCRGGILVYSKWGLEASDPALINPIEN